MGLKRARGDRGAIHEENCRKIAGDFFPLKHFAAAFRACFDPTEAGMQFHWGELAYMALWGVVAAVLAIRYFKWEPSASSGRRGRRTASKKPD